MIREQTVYQSPLVGVMRFDHPPGRAHRDPAEEISTHHSVSFIERGVFDLFHRGRRWRMGPATLFVTYPGLSYRCAHVESSPDDVSLSVHCAPELVEDMQATVGRRWTRSAPAAPLTNRLAYLRHRLAGCIRNGQAPMAAASLAGELLAALAGPGQDGSRLFSAGQIALYTRRIEAARELLSERPGEPHTLEATARAVGMSPFHFSRVFRQLVGVPPHRYLLNIRLQRAAQRLRDGSGVTEACHATGFNNLSHFIRSFQRAYGVTPSRYRG